MPTNITSSSGKIIRNRGLWVDEQEDIVGLKQVHRYYFLRPNWTITAEQTLEKPLFQLDLVDLTTYERSYSEGSVEITSQIEKALKWLLQKRIVVPQAGAVRDYLLRHFDMTDLLPSVCRIALRRFGIGARLSLELYRDPEIRDEYLTLYVRQERYDEHIMDIIEDVCAEYRDELTRRSSWLLVTTDFRPPM